MCFRLSRTENSSAPCRWRDCSTHNKTKTEAVCWNKIGFNHPEQRLVSEVCTCRCFATDSRRKPNKKPLYWKWISERKRQENIVFITFTSVMLERKINAYKRQTILSLSEHLFFFYPQYYEKNRFVFLWWRIRSTMRRPKLQSSRTAKTKGGWFKTSREPFCSWTHLQHLEDDSQSESSSHFCFLVSGEKFEENSSFLCLKVTARIKRFDLLLLLSLRL